MKRFLALLVGLLMLVSCVHNHRYYAHPWTTCIAGDTVIISAGQCRPTDSASEGDRSYPCKEDPWCVVIQYRPTAADFNSVRLAVDSLEYSVPQLSISSNLSSEPTSSLMYVDWHCLVFGPIVLPCGYHSDFQVEMVVHAYNEETNAAIEHRSIGVTFHHVKETEIYWGR
jgi:hypothetical protein